MASERRPLPESDSSPFAIFRDIRFLQVLAQVIFIILVFLVTRWLVGNLLQSLETRGLGLSFSFLSRTAGFKVGEGLPMERTDPYWYAYVVGLFNSLRVILLGLALATVVGIIAGVLLLSPNWLMRNIVTAYVEVIRNTPLLVQLFFLYFAVILKLPSLENRITLGPFVLSQRGFILPEPIPTGSFTPWMVLTLLGFMAAVLVYRRRMDRRIATGEETHPGYWALGLAALPTLFAWLLLPGQPLEFETAELVGLRMEGGTTLSPEFAGILFGLVLYTAGFIADIVRAGILAVQKGQREAATSLGLTRFQVLRLVIFPQALRVIIPPLTNQYLNLAKNSSLAVGIGFPDLYNVSSTIFNQSGQAVQVIALMMTTYLLISLVISALMNYLNDRLKIEES